MSLINDALRKARTAQTQQAAPDSPAPQFHPVEPVPAVTRRGLGLMLPIALGLLALLLLAAVWIWSQRREMVVRAKPDTPEQPPVTVTVHSAPVAAAPAPNLQPLHEAAPSAAPTRADPQPVGTPVTQVALAATPVPAPNAGTMPGAPQATTQSAEAIPGNAVTNLSNPITSTNATPPVPAKPKLMGIVFNPRRPSAVVNGKTVFVGDRVGEFRVQAITAETCLLIGGGKTNLLSLDN